MKRRNIFTCNSAAVVGLAALLAAPGCGSGSGSGSPGAGGTGSLDRSLPPAVQRAALLGSTVDPGIVTANNAFAFGLFNQLFTAAPTQNTLVSPVGLAIALEIAFDGAVGSTQTGMAKTLQLGAMTAQTVNTDNAALQAALVTADSSVQLNVANSLWLHPKTSPVLPAFQAMDTNYYGATIGDLAGAPGAVNTWVSNKTNGTITSILPAGDYQSLTALIVNAVYFKAAWKTKFNAAQTVAGTFNRLDGSTESCKMMMLGSGYDAHRGSNYTALHLPYGSGRFSMVIVLPDTGVDWKTFVGSLNATTWAAWTSGWSAGTGALNMPRFTVDFSASLQPPLTAMGMGVAFDSSQANFSGLAPEVFMGFVYHKTHMAVAENGTEASSATGVGIAPTSIEVTTYTVDHPFICAVRDDLSGEILFLGTVTDTGS